MILLLFPLNFFCRSAEEQVSEKDAHILVLKVIATTIQEENVYWFQNPSVGHFGFQNTFSFIHLQDVMSLVITNLQGEIQDRLEEAQYLREALNRTRESLECEQRLHSAAKTRKVKNVYK